MKTFKIKVEEAKDLRKNTVKEKNGQNHEKYSIKLDIKIKNT
jgi:hypothetical protein